MTSDTRSDSIGTPAFEWQKYAGRLDILTTMQDNPEYIDTLLVVDDGSQFAVNSVIVSVLGKEFTRNMLDQVNDTNLESHEKNVGGEKVLLRRVKVNKVPSHTMQVLINSCYSGQLTMSPTTVWSVMKVAEEYKMGHIISACCVFLSELVNQENCLEMYLIATKKGSEILLNSSFDMIRKHFRTVSNKKMFFGSITFGHFNELLSSDHLNVSDERIVWRSIKDWIRADEKDRISVLHRLITHIRYYRTSEEFFQELLLDPVINKEGPAALRQVKSIADAISSEKEQEKFRRDGNKLPVGMTPLTVRPRIPTTVLFAMGGWKTGQTCSLIETYDYMTDQWFRIPTESGPKKAYHGIEVFENIMYVIGGTNGNEILDSVHTYDPVSGIWTQKKSLGTKRCYVATAILNGKIYAVGGHNGDFRMRSAEVYDPKKDEWSPIAEMVIARSDGSAAALNGLVYIAGGLNEGSIEASLEAYNPEKDEWTILRRMSSPRTSLAVVTYNRFLYAIGGNSGFERLASAEKYDPECNTWTRIPNMIGKRSTFKADVVDGKIYVCGGYNGHHPIPDSEVYDPEIDLWEPVSDLSASRSGLAVVAIEGLPNAANFTYHGNSK